MKRIAIISNIPTTAGTHQAILESIFPNTSIEVATLFDRQNNQLKADVAVVTALDLVPYAQKYLDPACTIVQSTYTLEKTQLNIIQELERTGPIVVAHESPRAALARHTLLQRLGIPAERMRVWYPGMDEKGLAGHIVLFGDMSLPTGYMEELRIKGRLFSVTTIFEIALGLGVHDVTSSQGFMDYFSRVCTQFRPSMNDLTVSEFNAVTGNAAPQRGLLAFTGNLHIFYCDAYVASMVQKSPQELIGQFLFEAFPFLRSCQIHRGNETQEQLVVYDGKTYAVKLNLVLQTGRETGYLQVSDYWAEEQRQGKLRRQVSGKRSTAKYTFHDIVGTSRRLAECKAIAQRMARSDSNILITGATGVGKELFAQSIHNESRRKHQPFIAVNCGALVESLLESELFGYEKGAFTGANKNGKQGLFELAHQGTLFLDEIGEMPLHLQVRLLRVLQEKEVVRVGGDLVIPVDVRVIAATNQDIPQMIRNREFRSDLFYRLNVLPLDIPPLSDRKEDIPLLVSYFMHRLKVSFTLSPAARERMLAYPFPGNIRELRNCVEYLSNLGLEEIQVTDLPPYIFGGPEPQPSGASSSESTPTYVPQPSDSGPASEVLSVLEAVSVINSTGIGAGRRSIRAYLANRSQFFSEISIRKILSRLSDQGLVRIELGRGGIHITQRGEAFLRNA